MKKTQVFCDGCKREINTNHEADGGESYFRFDEVRAFYEGITIYPNVRHLCKDCFKKVST